MEAFLCEDTVMVMRTQHTHLKEAITTAGGKPGSREAPSWEIV